MASGKWKPHRHADENTISKGPSTRHYISPRKNTYALKLIKRLKGQRLASMATRAAKAFGRRNLSFTYDAGAQLYISHEGEEHAFFHPRRVTTLFSGQIERGRVLAYEYLLDQIEFSDEDWIIDVGANTGDLALAFRALGKRVNIEAFEPSPGDFQALRRNLNSCSAVNLHEAHQLALWNTDSEGLTFYLKPGSADSSVLPIKGATQTVTVPSKRLSDALGDDGRRFRLLKLEAEGAEPEILEGAEQLLPRIDFISADVGFERGQDAASTLPEVTNFLLQHGFEIAGFNSNRLVLLFRNTRR